MKIPELTFSEKVKYVRRTLKISQTQLARACGVSYATISRWEREGREPQMITLGKFDDFCKINGIVFESIKLKCVTEEVM